MPAAAQAQAAITGSHRILIEVALLFVEGEAFANAPMAEIALTSMCRSRPPHRNGVPTRPRQGLSYTLPIYV